MTSAVTTPANFFRALGDPTRWRVIRLVMDDALCVCELADILDMPNSSVSSHVQIIRKAGLLESETCGKWTYFRVARKHLALLRNCIKTLDEDPQHAIDVERSRRRLEDRTTSCCPGPKKLSQPRRTSATANRC